VSWKITAVIPQQATPSAYTRSTAPAGSGLPPIGAM
jgi:hypothetical protein